VQRADADAVAGEEDGALGEINERDGELALQVLEDAFAILLVKVDDDLGVGVRPEDVALGLELRLALRIIEQLAVVDDGDGAILVEDRLRAVAETDDRQAAVGEAEAGTDEVAVRVGAAVPDRIRHLLQHPRVGLPLTGEVDQSCDAAHRSSCRKARGDSALGRSPPWPGKWLVTQRRKWRRSGDSLSGQLYHVPGVCREMSRQMRRRALRLACPS